MSGRKRGEWQELGSAPGAWQFSRSGDSLAVSSGDRTTLATITSAGRLDVARNAVFSELPPGLWQVRNLEYVPPRAGNQRWNPATGLAPEHVRCPDGDGLLVPLGPVVLFLDAAAGKALGKPR